MVAMGMSVFVFHDGVAGLTPKHVFWVFGLVLCVFVARSVRAGASRSALPRLGHRASWRGSRDLWPVCDNWPCHLPACTLHVCHCDQLKLAASVLGIGVGEAAYFGILGITLVLILGLLAFIPVKAAET